MILKLDHISFSVDYTKEKYILSELNKYEKKFSYQNLSNIAAKMPLLYYKSQYHNITLLEKKDTIPIEITAYDKCVKEYQLMDITDNRVVFYSAAPKETLQFFQLMGFKEDNGILKLKTCLDTYVIEVKVVFAPAGRRMEFLDVEGFSSWAFICSSVEKERKRIRKAGYYVTDISLFEINKRSMEIFFAKGRAGELIEFIQFTRDSY